ncbi:MAG: hypothetical protein ACOYXY_00350 [Thermodesulfobacteriota bacterium]
MGALDTTEQGRGQELEEGLREVRVLAEVLIRFAGLQSVIPALSKFAAVKTRAGIQFRVPRDSIPRPARDWIRAPASDLIGASPG